MTEHSTALVVGGGFGGYYAADALARHHIEVTLVDTRGRQTFQPLLYQAATGLMRPADLDYDLNRMSGVRVVPARATTVDLAAKCVSVADHDDLSCDYLVMATGASVNFFGVDGAAEHAFPLYTRDDAAAIKARLQQLAQTKETSTIVVVGAGATGIEVTGAIQDVATHVLPETYPEFRGEQVKIRVIDRADAPLSSMSTKSQTYARTQLEDVGVEFHLGRSVTKVTADGVTLDDGSTMSSQLTIWAGGLQVRLPDLTPAPPSVRGRIQIESDLRITGHDNAYAVGDSAADREAPLPQLGSVAKQQGHHAADNIHRQHAGKEPKPFHYRDMGDMAMVRYDAAVVEMGADHHEVTGKPAFLMWLGLHAYLLPGSHHRRDAIHEWFHEFSTGRSRFLKD
ncbi:MAG: NAD(P)/FAD-dependent oxidoreductase [Candidatus Nanopelagicales bacterium]